jgi:pimeloyl-ACP methyl ester carboxylesterase
MLKYFALGVIVTVMASSSAFSQQLTPPEPTSDANPMGAILAKRAALVAQCQPSQVLPKAEAEGSPIHVTTWGHKGPVVLFVHGGVQGGLGGGPSNFAEQKPLSAEGWLLKLPDRPGFGMSPSRGPDDQESDAIWIAEMLGDGSHVIGHSFGGAEALLAAGVRPQAVRSLVLIEPALQPLILTDPDSMRNPDALAALQNIGTFFITARTPAEFARLFAGSLGKGEDGGPNPSLAALAESPEKGATLGCALLQARPASAAAMRQAAEIAAQSHIPVLVISGGYSPAQDKVAEIVAKLTHGRHVIVSSPNHFVQQMNPKEFNRVVNDFMSDADRRRGKP